jgi:hypothetical protein
MANCRSGALCTFALFSLGLLGEACSGQSTPPFASSGSSGAGAVGGIGASGLGVGSTGAVESGNTSGSATTTGASTGSAGSGAASGTPEAGATGSGSGVAASSGAPASDAAAGSGAMSGSSAASGASSGTGLSPTSVCYGAGTRPLANNMSDAFIDDFEEAAISPGWSSFNDVMPTQNAFQIMAVAGGAVGTAHAGHYAGTGAITTAMGGFGVGAVYNTAIDPASHIYCIDISAFDGVSFWAKAATAGSVISLNFVLPQTNMASTDAMGRPNGGDCTANCYSHPFVSVTLTTDWAQYAVEFSDAGGGSAAVANVIQELAWLSPDSDWDFTLDEIAFYKGTPPTGPVGPGPSN